MKTFLTIGMLVMASACVADDQYVPIKQIIPGIPKQVSEFQQKTKVPVVIPKEFPSGTGIGFATFSSSVEGQYQIVLSQTPDCDGNKSCLAAMISAETGANPAIAFNMEKKPITKIMALTPKVSAYLTPSYAIGSTMPAQIAFRCKNVLFTLTWNTKGVEEDILIRLAKDIAVSEPSCTAK